jgi:hypothetical protein
MSCVKHGDALRIAEPGSTLDDHVWFVVSDPIKNPSKVLLLNMTSWGGGRGKDSDCVLDTTDHRLVKRKSCIEFGRPKVAKAADLHRLCSGERLRNLGTVSGPLLTKILHACAKARNLAIEHRELLAEQDLITL